MAKYHRNHHKRAANKGQSNTKQNQSGAKLMVWITVGFAAVIILLAVLTVMQDKEPDRFTELPDLTGQQVYGDEDAPITLIEFGDYMCPTCMQWDKLVFPQLQEEYIETGKVKYVYINAWFQGEPSILLSLASESVYEQDPENFWDFHHAIFDAQAALGHQSNWVSPELLLSLAEETVPGIDLAKLEEDIRNQTAFDKLRTDMAIVEKYGVRATPTVMINGIVLDNASYDSIKSTIERELEANDA